VRGKMFVILFVILLIILFANKLIISIRNEIVEKNFYLLITFRTFCKTSGQKQGRLFFY